MAHSPKPSPSTEIAKGVTPPRRGFMTEAAAVLIAGIVAIFPFAAGLIPFFDPLRRGSGGAKNLRIASLDAVPDDGVPRRFPVVADLVDAWTNYGKEPIGAVYLVRDKGSKDVRALNAICPHAGCMVAFEVSKDLFQCPCHTSAFDVAGKRRLDISKVPPRDMDTLSCSVKDGEVWVEFMNFQTGHAEKTPKA